MSTSPSLRDRRFGTIGSVLLALLVGCLVYGVSCLIVPPGPQALTFGAQWQQMSRAPFDLRGQFPHRILAPLLAHVIGMGGDHFVLFVRGLAVLLLGTVFFFCRWRGAALADALLVALAVAVTAPIQMYKVHWVGYVDALCYALFFWAWMAARQPVLFWGLFFANLLNHELAVFLLPWAWFVRRQVNGSRRSDLIGASLAVGLYVAFYQWVKANAPSTLFTNDYFASHPLFPGGSVVVWALAITHLVVAFGPVLAVLAWHQHRPEHGRERWHLWLVAAGIVVIFCIAFDWARHSNLIVLPLVLASLRFLGAGHRAAYVLLVLAGVIGMLLVPPWTARAWPTHRIIDPAMNSGLVIVNKTGPVDVQFGPLGLVFTNWLPFVWPMLTAIFAILAAIWTAGLLFARWPGRAQT